jgi:hypothetical protein
LISVFYMYSHGYTCILTCYTSKCT